jgi:hypothetical protein
MRIARIAVLLFIAISANAQTGELLWCHSQQAASVRPQEHSGLQGPVGPTGSTGATGATSPQSPIGLTGPIGAEVPQVIPGANGSPSLRGATGPAGATGAQRLANPTGLPGSGGAITVPTDCTTAADPTIQAAINSNLSPVILPPTYGGCLKLTQPLYINRPGATIVQGAGASATKFSKAYDGPTFIIQDTTPAICSSPALLTGSGGSFNGLGTHCTVPSPLDLSQASFAVHLNGLTHFTAEATIEIVTPNSGGPIVISQYQSLFSKDTPIVDNAGAFDLRTASSQNQIEFILNIGGTAYKLTSGPLASGVPHHVAGTYDGSIIRLFTDGTLAASQAASGPIVSGYKERVTFGDIGINHFIFPGYIDSLRLSNVARYTANFARPTTKFTPDGQTMMLLNWAASPVPGTVIGYDNTSPNGKVFLPYEANPSGAPNASQTTLLNMDLDSGRFYGAGPAVVAYWAYNSHYDYLDNDGASGGTDVVFDFHDNDYQSEMSHVIMSGGSKYRDEGSTAINLGNQSGGVNISDVQIDTVGTTIGVSGPSDAGTLRSVRITDRGSLIYPFVSSGNVVYDSDFIDSEGGSAIQCGLYTNAGWAPTAIIGGEWDLVGPGNLGAAFLCVNGGQPVTVLGAAFSGSGLAEFANIIAPPARPIALHEIQYPNGLPLTNPGMGAYVVVK